MAELGSLSLYGVVALALYAGVMCGVGALRQRESWVRSGERAVHAAFGLLVLAFALLEWALINDRFDLKFVSKISAVEQPLVFKLAIWGGQEGSLLLWASMLGAMASLVVIQNRNRNRERPRSEDGHGKEPGQRLKHRDIHHQCHAAGEHKPAIVAQQRR